MTTPPPFPPFMNAREVDTEPGLGVLAVKADLLAAQKEVFRLRRERNEWRAKAEQALTSSAPGSSILPDLTRRQRTMGAIAQGSKYAGLFTLAALALRAVSKTFPEYAELIDGVLGAFGL